MQGNHTTFSNQQILAATPKDKMQLKTGFYYISTIVTSPWGERWVQRDSVENKSMLSKPVNIQVNETGAAEVLMDTHNGVNAASN